MQIIPERRVEKQESKGAPSKQNLKENIMNQGWIILILYGAVMISATVLFTRKESNVEKFCVGSRNG